MVDVLAGARRLVEAEIRRSERARAVQVAIARRQIEDLHRAAETVRRRGADLARRTAGEFRELGAATLETTLPRAVVERYLPPRSRTPPTRRPAGRPGAPARPAGDRLTTVDWRNARREADRRAAAVIHGAGDELTFGGADWASAGVRTLAEGGFDDWGDRIHANMEEERAQDRYDAEHYGAERAIGQVGGAVGSFFIPGGAVIRGGKAALGAAKIARLALRERSAAQAIRAVRAAMTPARNVVRARAAPGLLRGAARTSLPEQVAWAVGPGVANAVVQLGDDVISGRNVTAGDVGSAFAGGVVTGLTRRLGPAGASALGAATQSALQDLAEHQAPSIERMSQAAYAGRVFGGIGGQVGRRWSNGLSSTRKGLLGERMGRIRSAVNDQIRETGKKIRELIEGTGRRWEPDGRSGLLRFEDKFGPWARLSHNQELAREMLGDNFILYHFTPEDVARIAAAPTGIVGSWGARRMADHP